MNGTNRLAVMLLSILMQPACTFLYRPKQPVPPGKYSKQMLADVSSPDLLSTYNNMAQSTEDEKKKKVSRRNQILEELIWLVDQNYYSFESNFYGSQAVLNTTGDFINLGLTGTSSVTGSAHLKSVLSAIATGTTGLKTSIDKNFFDQQTRAALVSKMRALRATQLATIQDDKHMKAGVANYSLESVLSDIDAYYDAGTLIGALQSISATSGQEANTAQTKQQDNSKKPQVY